MRILLVMAVEALKEYVLEMRQLGGATGHCCCFGGSGGCGDL